MAIFQISKSFPKEETYSLTDQIRGSSRSVTANIAEAYRKRQYPKHFISKLSDSDAEISETQTWLEFAFHCNYINNLEFEDLSNQCKAIGKLINFVILNPKKFGCKSGLPKPDY